MKLYVSCGVNPLPLDEGDVVTEWGEYGWYCKDEVDEAIVRLETELAEWKTRCLTSEAFEEDAQQTKDRITELEATVEQLSYDDWYAGVSDER